MSKKAKARFLAQCLQEIADGASPEDFGYEHDNRDGLCSFIGEVTHSGRTAWLGEAARDYPEYSGRAVFPVPHPEGHPPGWAYRHTPLWEGEYGENRRDYAQHLSDYILEHFT